MLELNVAGVSIRNRPSFEVLIHNLEGLFFKDRGFQGWDDLTDTRRQAVPRPTANGEFDTRVYAGARVVTCDGHAFASSDIELAELGDALRSIGIEGERVRLSVTHQGRTLWADARRTSVEFDDRGVRSGGRIRAEFSLQFVCADPRRYGELNTFAAASSLTLYHRGNATSYPVLEIPNAPSSYTITHPSGTLVVSGATAGQTHRIFTKTKRFTSNGSRVFGKLSGTSFGIGRGRRPTVSISSGQVRALVTDTFG